jgi:hypothetical protein
MLEVCDPDADLDVLKKLIKMNTGHTIKLTKEQTCQVYDDIKAGKLPLPPLIMSSNKTYLVDKKSPLKPADYEILFDSSSKRVDIKKVARKVGLVQLDQMTKSQMIDSIGKRLRFMKIHEPVKIGQKRTPVAKKEEVFNNTAVMNNTAVTNNFTNTNVVNNRKNNFENTNVAKNNFTNTTVVNNRKNNFTNTGVVNNRKNTTLANNRRNTTVVNTNRRNKPTPTTRVNFPKGGLFMTGQRPKFLNGRVSAVKKPKTSFFASLFGPKQTFIQSNTFKGAKKGYVFRTGNQGTGYYMNEGPVVVQGPTLPPVVPITKPNVPSNISMNNATNTIKKLQLKREKPFLNKLKVSPRKSDVVEEAIKYKSLESNFITKIGQMSMSETNRNTFIRRMATDDLKQLEAEAQLKSDEFNNVAKNNEQKMNIILATLPFLNDASKQTYKVRAAGNSVNINSLIEEAKKDNETKRDDFVSNQKKKFMAMITNVKLSDEDKKSLEELIDNKTNLNSMKNRAEKLVEQRIQEKKAVTKQNLLTYLTPLKINQTNKNNFITRFNKGESINAIKRAAKEREEEVARGETQNVRSRLVRNLNALNLNSQDKNVIMGKFNNGNKNIGKLVEEAKRLKNTRNTEKLKLEKQRLNTLAKQLGVNVNLSKLNTLNGVPGFEQRIRNAGAEKVKGTFAEKVQALSIIASNMNLNTNLQSNILKLKNDTELNAMKVRVIGAGKTKLSNRAKSLNVNFSRNISGVNNVAKLAPLRQKINNAGAAKKGAQNQKEAERLAERRRELKNYINKNTTLSQNKKNAFVRQVNLNTTNLNQLRKEIDTEIQQTKNTKRSKNLNELESYLQPLNINKTKFIQMFKNSNISLTNIKAAINKEVAAKGDLNSKKRTLSNKIDEAKQFNVTFNFNTNMSTLNSTQKVEELNNKVDAVIERAINKGRDDLSNKIINSDVKNDFMNKVTAIKSLKNLKNVQKQIENTIISKKSAKKEEITKYMKGLGLNNQEIQTVVGRNLSLNDSRNMANDILDKKKRLELTKLLDEKKIPVADRKQFYNKITKNSKIQNITKNVDDYLSKKSRETLNNITQVLNKYNLKNVDRVAILNDWNYYPTMTVMNVKNQASKRAEEFKREKEVALRKYLTDDLKLAANDVETIMKNFNLNPRNMGTLREKAQKLKNISGEKNRLTERIRKAREENGLNLKFKVNVKTANNVKNLNNKINKAYVGKAKKNLARRALNRNINISNELNAIKSMNNVQKLKNKLNGLVGGKKKEDLEKLEEVIKNLNQENKNRFLQKFKNQNNSLGNLLNNVQTFKNNKEKQKFEGKKQELYKYLNETLNLNVKDRDAIMFEFNTSKNLNAMKQKANTLKKTRDTEKIATNRKKLEEILKSMNLSQENKDSILNKFDKQPGNLETFEANAKSMSEKRRNEKRANERQELMRHIDALGLSGENRNRIIGVFDQSFNKTLNSAKNNATTLKQTRNQEKLENALKGFTSISENNKAKLRSDLKSGVNLNSVILSGKRLNASAKTRKSTEQAVINYVTSKKLGENGDKLIKNFKNGLITARKVREEADKKKMSLNANIITNKKTKLRDIMKNTLLTDREKDRFINRIRVDTNIGNLEKNIKNIDKDLKNKRDTFARKQTELRAFLNGLTNLTTNQKTKFMTRVKNHTTPIDGIKREAKRIDDAKKKGKATTLERAKPNEENNFNAAKAMNIINKQRAGEEKRRERAKARENNNFNATKALENLNTNRAIQEVKNYVMKSTLPENKKQVYIKQIEKPGTNLKPIPKLVNQDVRMNKLQTQLRTDILRVVTGFTGQYRRGWERAVDEAKTMPKLREIGTDLTKKTILRGEIDKSKIGPLKKQGHLRRVMDIKDDVTERRRIFEEQVREKLLVDEIPARESAINRMVSLTRNRRTMYKGKLRSAKTVNNLDAIKNEAQKENEKKKQNMKAQFKMNPLYNNDVKNNKSLNNALVKPRKNLVNGFKVYNVPTGELKNMTTSPGTKKMLVPKPPNTPKPEKPAPRTFKNIVQKNKEKRVVNAVKLAAKKTALSRASGPERVKMARNLAPRTQNNVKKVEKVVELFERREGISTINRLKKLPVKNKTIFKGRIDRAKSKMEINQIKLDAKKMNDAIRQEEERKKEVETKKKASDDFKREMVKTRALTETEKMKARVKENMKFNEKLAEKRRLLRERKPK